MGFLGGSRLPSWIGKPGAGCLFVVLEAQTLHGASWALLLCTILGAGILSPKKAELTLYVVSSSQIIALFCLFLYPSKTSFRAL